MTTALEADVQARLAAMADSLGDIEPPEALTTPALPISEPNSERTRRGWFMTAAALLLLIGGVAIWVNQTPSSTRVATTDDEQPAPPSTQVEPEPDTAEETPTSTAATADTWRPPFPPFGEALLRFDPDSVPEASLPDGQHFGILDRVADGGDGSAVRFSLGTLLTGQEATDARANAAASAGVAVGTDEEAAATAHDWWTPLWGDGLYIYPDFELPVSVPVNVADLEIIVNSPAPEEVTWSQFVDYAHGRGVLPYNWTGHTYITVEKGEIISIESFYTP